MDQSHSNEVQIWVIFCLCWLRSLRWSPITGADNQHKETSRRKGEAPERQLNESKHELEEDDSDVTSQEVIDHVNGLGWDIEFTTALNMTSS